MTALIGLIGIFGISYFITTDMFSKMMLAGDFDAMLTVGIMGALLIMMLGAKGAGKIIYWVIVVYMILRVVM